MVSEIASAARVTFHAATPERWADIEALFGPRGACGGCWCMFPRLRGAEFTRNKGAPNRRALRGLVARGTEPGILAYAGSEPIGWCALAPRESYPRIGHSRLFGGESPRGTWSVVCFFVARPWRARGLCARLLDAAAVHAKRHGATMLEGYPIEPRGATADAFAWTGHVSSFRNAGFREVARPSPTRPLMQRALGGRTAAAKKVGAKGSKARARPAGKAHARG
jgi:GNAT superfamily N-acetyltransferase